MPLYQSQSNVGRVNTAGQMEVTTVHPKDSEDEWFFEVLGNIDLLRSITLCQNGKKHIYFQGDWGDYAAARGFLGLMKYKQHTLTYTQDAMNLAAERGHLGVVKWLQQHIIESASIWAMVAAARNGHLPIVQYLYRKHGAALAGLASSYARKFGHMHIVQWLANPTPNVTK
jgi:hypothetical protein